MHKYMTEKTWETRNIISNFIMKTYVSLRFAGAIRTFGSKQTVTNLYSLVTQITI